MPTAQEIRTLREQIITRIHSLREFDDQITEQLDAAEEAFDEVR